MTSPGGEEIETKFCLQDLPGCEARLMKLGAHCTQIRTFELNLRLDTSSGSLRKARQVLRLRKNATGHLTFKGPGRARDGVVSRLEVELTVDDFEAARRLLEALGYEVVFIYEKYRRVFSLGHVQAMLDELPFGNFLEIEGPETDIRNLASSLQLKWQNATAESYHSLFEHVRDSLGINLRDLTFANFVNLKISNEILGVRPAD